MIKTLKAKNTNNILVSLTALWLILWYTNKALAGWIWILSSLICLIPSYALLSLAAIGLSIATLIQLTIALRYKHPKVSTFLPLFMLIIAFSLGWKAPIPPSKTEVQFYQYHQDFKQQVDLLLNTQETQDSFFLPATTFYNYGVINTAHTTYLSKNTVISFVIDNCYQPLVFIERDNANAIYPPNSEEYIIKKLESHWYITKRHSLPYHCLDKP